jgi:hypothetical protein
MEGWLNSPERFSNHGVLITLTTHGLSAIEVLYCSDHGSPSVRNDAFLTARQGLAKFVFLNGGPIKAACDSRGLN